jgi:hypothetical protein
MHTTKQLTAELGVTALRPDSEAAVHQRRLGKVYRLILNYDPQKMATTQDKLGVVASETGCTQSATG